jgi:hypothetical protein
MNDNYNNKSDRPIVKIPYNGYDIALWALAVLGIIFGFLLILEYWSVLPEIVPLHISASGSVDALGNKYFLMVIPVVAATATMGAAIVARYPHRFNFPWRITDKNAARQYTLARRLILWINVETVWVAAFIVLLLIDFSVGSGQSGRSPIFPGLRRERPAGGPVLHQRPHYHACLHIIVHVCNIRLIDRYEA